MQATFTRQAVMGLLVSGLTVSCKNGEKTPAVKPHSETRAQAKAKWTAVRNAEIYFTTGTLGYVEPCGCTSKPLGGIQRLASIVKAGAKDRLVLDAGNLLLPKDHLDEATREQHVFKSEILARMYRKLGVAAINLGASDIGAGTEVLRALQREGAVPLVSANVRPVKDKGPMIAQSLLRKIGGMTIGITGVASAKNFSKVPHLQTSAWTETLEKELVALEKQGAELLIVLADLDAVESEKLARKHPKIDFVLRSPGTEITRKPAGPKRVGKVVIIESGSQGQYVGRLSLALGARPPTYLQFDDGGYAAERKRELLRRKVSSLKREIDTWAKDKSKKAAVEARKVQLQKFQKRLNKISSSQALQGPNARYQLIALSEDVPSDPDTEIVLEAYYAKLEAMNLKKGNVARCKKKDKKSAVYVGTQACVECHEEAYDFWKTTKHAKAWKTLEDDNKHFDLTCIGCHTVGYQEPGGFCRLVDVGNLKDVGCEMCHGPGSVHKDDEDPDSIILASSRSTCADYCHVPEHSDQFEYTKYLEEITGEGHELSEASALKK